MKNKERIEALEERLKRLIEVKAGKGYVNQLQKRIEALEKKNLSLDLTKADNKLFGRLRNRIEALENHIVKPDEMIDYSEVALDLVKQRVIELIQLQGYVSVGDDGEIWCHDVEPKTLTYDWYSAECKRYVASMNLNGVDWKQCLWKISDLLADSDVKKNFTTENNERSETALNEQKQAKSTDKECSAINNKQALVKKSSESLTNVQNLHIAHVDWKNLLSVYDVKKLCGYEAYSSHTRELNKLIHERIKPLRDDNNSLHKEIDRLNKQCIGLAKQNAELEALNKTYKLSILESYRINKPN